MTALRIRACGPAATVQDAGRTGYLRFGVSESGPMDWARHALANRMAGNDAGAAAVEIGPGGIEVEATGGPVLLAVAGPGAEVATPDGLVSAPCTVVLPPGGRLAVRQRAAGMWAYLAVAGGVDRPAVLGSRATNAVTGLGGAPLRADDELAVGEAPVPLDEGAVGYLDPVADSDAPVSVTPGPQAHLFSAGELEAFVATAWRVSERVDRMGVRLDGGSQGCAGGHDIVSDGIALGSVQIPGDGLPTVLTADRQPTGGYPKIATVVRADLPALVQRRPGQRIRFAWTTVEAAADRLLVSRRALARPVRAVVDRPDTARLLSVNLVDGVVDAFA